MSQSDCLCLHAIVEKEGVVEMHRGRRDTLSKRTDVTGCCLDNLAAEYQENVLIKPRTVDVFLLNMMAKQLPRNPTQVSINQKTKSVCKINRC